MDELQILIQAILSLKDTTKSKQQILSELPKLEKQLQSDNKSKINITAGLDITKSKNLIQAQLNDLTNQAKAPTVKIGVDVNKNIGQDAINSLKDVQTQAQQTASSIKRVSSTPIINENDIAKSEKLAQKVSVLTQRVKTYQATNTKSNKVYGSQLNAILEELNDPKINNEKYNRLYKYFQELQLKIKETGDTGKRFFEKLGDQATKFTSWMTLMGVVAGAWRDLQKMVSEVVELDSAMSNLKKVTDETETTYARFLDNASEQAKELHTTTTDLVEQVATWSKLGFSLQDSENLAKVSMIYSKVGEVDNTTAVSDLVTVMKAFNIESSKSITIVDALNILGNNFATDAASLGEGLTKSASALDAANNSFEQSVALLTGGTEITQNANEMGSALKVISMRIRGMKGELEALGEEYEDIESISKIQTQILNLSNGKVNIFDDNGNFRSTYDILKDISEIYDKLSDPARANLTEVLFGKMRGNQGIALIQAFQSGQIQKAYETALNSAGSAQEEFDRWSQSIEAHIGTFKASFESLSKTIVDSDLIKFVVDGGTNILNILDKIIDKIGTLPTILGGVAAVLSFKNVGERLNTPVYVQPQLICA